MMRVCKNVLGMQIKTVKTQKKLQTIVFLTAVHDDLTSHNTRADQVVLNNIRGRRLRLEDHSLHTLHTA